MLVVNIWEGSDKWTLAFGSQKVYGHAALTIPPQNPKLVDEHSTYISWWPSNQNETDTKGGKTDSSDRQKDRSFAEDLWAENSHRYRCEQVFTLPHSAIPTLKEGITTAKEASELVLKFLPNELKNTWKSKGHELSDGWILVGRVPGGGQWIVDDTKAKNAYLCFKGSTELKVQHFTGNRLFAEHEVFSEDVRKLVAGLKDKEIWQSIPCPSDIKQILAGKKYPLTDDARLQAMSGYQYLIKTKDKDTYFSITEKDAKKSVLTFYQWSRMYLAPTANIEIPTLTADGKGLDDAKILRWWKVFNSPQHPRWEKLAQNCSLVAGLALRVGGAARYATPHVTSSWLCWTPTDVQKYAEAVAKGINSKKAKPRMPMEGPLNDFDFEDFKFETASCVWSRASFENTSKLKSPDIRSSELKDIDKLLDEYAKLKREASKGAHEARIEKLSVLLDKIAKFMSSKPESKRAAALFDLAERAIVEKTKLLELI